MSGRDEESRPNPPSARRRHHRVDYRARNFWELCVITQLQRRDALHAVTEADKALIAWRKTWETREGLAGTDNSTSPDSKQEPGSAE